MPESEDWIARRAMAARSTIPDAVVNRVVAQLQGVMSERQLRQAELDQLVDNLLGDMAPPAATSGKP